MKLPDALTPLRIGLGLLAVVAAVVAIALWNPWSGYLRSRVAAAEAETETTQDTLRGQIEASEGQAYVSDAAQDVRVIIERIRESTYAVETEARAAPGADDALDPDTLARQRANDERLCAIHPAVCSDGPGGPGPGPDASPGGEGSL